MNEKTKSRLTGVLALGLGLALLHINHQMIVDEGIFFVKAAIAGPLLVVVSFYYTIEAPPLRPFKPSPFGWFCYILGTILGILNAGLFR